MDAEALTPPLPGPPGRGGPTVLGTLLELAGARVAVFDSRLRLVRASRAMREAAGWAVSVPTGSPLHSVFVGSAGEVAAIAAAAASGGSWSGRLGLAAAGLSAEDVWVGSSARDDGGASVLVLVAAESPAHASAEAARAHRLEALGQLSAGISHDFNNLLTAITGYAALARAAAPAGGPIADDLDQVILAADRGAALVSQLVAFSRRQAMRPEPVDINEAVRGVEPLLRRLLPEGVELRLSLTPRTAMVLADLGQLEQVLVNLATNARDAMPRGGRLTLETTTADLGPDYADAHPGARQGPHAVLAVSDTGTGMDPETLSHVFEPFFTTKGPDLGTGLGLATVHGIVGQLGGRLPEGTGPAAAPALAHGSGPGQAAGSETILVVEDAEPIRRLIARVLEGAGYRVLHDARPGDALARSRGQLASVDLLLTDMVMPEMSGPELAAVLLDRVPGLRVLCMSGYAEQAAESQGLGAAVSDFLPKPFQAGELTAAVRQLLDRRP
jgi:hypothetical protein